MKRYQVRDAMWQMIGGKRHPSAKVPHDAEGKANMTLDVCGSGRFRDRLVPDVGPGEECGVVVDEDAATEPLAHSHVQTGAEGHSQAKVGMRVGVVDGWGLWKW